MAGLGELLNRANWKLNFLLPPAMRLVSEVYVLKGDWESQLTDIPWFPVRAVLSSRRHETFPRARLTPRPPAVDVGGDQGGSFQVYLCEVK